MANEFSCTIVATSTKTGATMSTGSLVGYFTPGLDADNGVTQNVAYAASGDAEALSINGDITPASEIGFLIVRNEGYDSTGAATTKKVTLSFDSAISGNFASYQFAEIPAGMCYAGRPKFPTGKTAIYVNAESGATNGVQIRKWVASV